MAEQFGGINYGVDPATGLGGVFFPLPKHNPAATAAPVAGDNFAAGWARGSLWVFGGTIYGCTADGVWLDLGASGGGGAPVGAQYLVGAADATLTAERVVTDTPTVAWDLATAGQAKANVPDASIGTVKLGGDITAAGKALLDDANAAAQRTTLGLGTAAVKNVPAAGDAAAGEVVLGNDTRLTASGHAAEVHTQTAGTGTFAIPAWAVGFDAVVISGAGGGGSGRVGAAATIRPGGQGGGPGARTIGTFLVADLGGAAALYYDVGAGGAGGAANAGPTADGTTGAAGADSLLRVTNAAGAILLKATGGQGGTQGSSGLATGVAQAGGSGHFAGGLGGVASTNLANVTNGSGGPGGAPTGGGAGGSITSANALIANSTGGNVWNATNLAGTPLGGLGGNGTVSATAAAVAAGAAGAGYGAGGGGSGGATNTFGTGKGGDGAAGVVWVRFYA
jgi:hypothetical protein